MAVGRMEGEEYRVLGSRVFEYFFTPTHNVDSRAIVFQGGGHHEANAWEC